MHIQRHAVLAVVLASALLSACGIIPTAGDIASEDPTPSRTPPWLGPTSTPSPTATATPEGRALSPRELDASVRSEPADALALPPNTVAGRLVDESGEPMGGIPLTLGFYNVASQSAEFMTFDPPGPQLVKTYSTYTGGDGTFWIKDLPGSADVIGDRYVLSTPLQSHPPCPPNCLFAYVVDGAPVLAECDVTDENPPPLEEWFLIELAEGEAVDLGDVTMAAFNSPLCK